MDLGFFFKKNIPPTDCPELTPENKKKSELTSNSSSYDWPPFPCMIGAPPPIHAIHRLGVVACSRLVDSQKKNRYEIFKF